MADPSTDPNSIANFLPNFVNPAYATPAQRAQMYAYANELIKPTPVNNWAQGLGSIARALMGGYESHLADQAERGAVTRQQQLEAPLYGAAGNLGGGASAPTSQVAPDGSGPQASNISGSILQQESGGNPNAPTSIDGAHGPGQIMPATFAAYAKPGEKIDNPADNLAVHQRIISDYAQRYDNDPARVAVAYFSGPGNVAPPGSATPWLHDREDGNGKSVSSYVADVTGRIAPHGGTQLAGPVPTPDSAPATQVAQGAPQAQMQAGPRGGISPQQAAAIMASPDTSPETKHMVMQLFGPQVLQDPYGGNHPYVPIQGAAAPSATPQAHFGNVGVPGASVGTVTTPGPGGVPQTQLAIPGNGMPPNHSTNGAPIGGPLDALAPIVQQGQGMAAAGDVTAAKAKANQERFQSAQQQGPALLAAAYPLRQLQSVLEKNGGHLPTGEGATQLMHGLSLANTLGSLIGHPIAQEDSTLPAMELLKKYGMQAAQSQAQSLGLHTNLGLESAETTSPNTSLSGATNQHLVDNLIRLNQVSQKKAQFEHDYYLSHGQGPNAYDNFTQDWQNAISGPNAIPLSKYGRAVTLKNGGKGMYVPSTDPSGFSLFPADDPAFKSSVMAPGQ